VAALLAVSLLLAACTTGATTAPTAAPTGTPAAATPGATVVPSATPLPGSKRFSFAFTSPGLSSVAIMEAISVLKGQGYTIDTPSIAQANLAVEGVINGQFQVTAGSTLSYLLGAQKGSAIRIVGNRNNNENTLTVAAAIRACADLAGKVWAHGGESATSTFMGRNWAKQNCPGTTANEIQMPGSDLRAAAMLSGQVDAAEIEVADAVGLTSGANASRFHVLVSFADELPNLKTSPIAANSTWAAQNPGDLVALLKAVIAENRKINADSSGGYLKSLAQKWAPNVIKAETIDNVARTYVERKLFPSDAGVTTADIEYTIKFFTDAGVLPQGLTVTQAADLVFVNHALRELGG
jgi:NitT/TauT family transport system substrate-binding protein